ncbi:MAG: hypothetical protein L7H18_01910 [Candidatus Nealsonbacteria bacterium DGGOD1a]|nr:MAG: hypothetical protein L7H18_01910 [Candidatus Nealsonbacteria bacterium DGGOD1a]
MVNKQKLGSKINNLLLDLKKISNSKGIPAVDSNKQPCLIKLCDTVVEFVPEFKNCEDFLLFGKENPYLHFGVFGSFLCEQIDKDIASDAIERGFNFVNESYNNMRDEHIQTMLSTEILEKLTASEKMIVIAKKFLIGDALNQFQKMLE